MGSKPRPGCIRSDFQAVPSVFRALHWPAVLFLATAYSSPSVSY